jgi:hypothetical protein
MHYAFFHYHRWTLKGKHVDTGSQHEGPDASIGAREQLMDAGQAGEAFPGRGGGSLVAPRWFTHLTGVLQLDADCVVVAAVG